MTNAETSRNKEEWEKAIFTAALIGGAAWLMADPAKQVYAFYGIGFLIVFLLLEIRGKLEAIRFMMADYFLKKHDDEFKKRDDELDGIFP